MFFLSSLFVIYNPKIRISVEIIIVKDEAHTDIVEQQNFFFLEQGSKKETRTLKTKAKQREPTLKSC